MATTTYKHVKYGLLSYQAKDGSTKKINLQSTKDIQITNSFKLPYKRGIVGFFNTLVSRYMYFSVYDKSGRERNYPVAQTKVYFSSKESRKVIDRSK